MSGDVNFGAPRTAEAPAFDMNTTASEAFDAAFNRLAPSGLAVFDDVDEDLADIAVQLGPVEVVEIVDYCLSLLESKDALHWELISDIGLELIAARIKIAPEETMKIIGPMLEHSHQRGDLLNHLAPTPDYRPDEELPDEALPWLLPLVERAETLTEMERTRLAFALLRSRNESVLGQVRQVLGHMEVGSEGRKNVETALDRRVSRG